MAKKKTYEQGKIDGEDKLIEKFNSLPPIIYSTPPRFFSEQQIEELKIEILDNFPDLSNDDRLRILDWITCKFYYNNI